MERRALLGSLAAGFGGAIAGCGGRSEEREPADPPAESPPNGSEPETENGWETLQNEFEFEERLDAVEDLGWDPEGERRIDPWLTRSLDRDALVEVPPGRYKIAESIEISEASNWGLLGLGEDRTDVRFVTTEGSRVEFKVLGGADLLFENFAFDQGPEFDRSMGMRLSVDDNLLIRNVEKAGANPTSDPEGVNALALNVIDPDGAAVVDTFVRAGPQDFRSYPENELCVFTGRAHEGTVTYRNLDIRNAGENGIYASKCPGEVHVEGGFYKNNRNDGVRISGEGSTVSGATVVIDSDDFHPDNSGVEGNMRGIRMQSGDRGYTGGLIEDTDLDLRSTFQTQALVQVSHNQGGMTMRDCRLRNWTDYASFRVEEPSDYVETPWGVRIEDTQFTEHGPGGSAITIAGRPNSELRNVSVDTTRDFGVRHGIEIADCDGTVFEDVTVRTNGYPLRIERSAESDDEFGIEFNGGNDLRTTADIDLDLADTTRVDIDGDEPFFPFREAAADAIALLVTRVTDDGVRFGTLTE